MTIPNDVLIALIGFGGVIVGAVFSVAGQFLFHWFQEKPRRKADQERRKLLMKMLSNPQHLWRKFDTLQRVIGADEETTMRLLLEIGARGSEAGSDVWGLVSRNPLPTEQ